MQAMIASKVQVEERKYFEVMKQSGGVRCGTCKKCKTSEWIPPTYDEYYGGSNLPSTPTGGVY